MLAEKESTRRGFLEVILGASAVATLGAILYPIYRYLVPPPVAEADPSQLKLTFTQSDIAAEPQKAKYFKYGRELGIIFLTDTGELKALSATCTHLSCTVQNLPEQGIIWCACHNGKYSVDGKNISGPPPKPLTAFKVKVADKDIFVSRENA
jgi:Rieske Fe-S protein